MDNGNTPLVEFPFDIKFDLMDLDLMDGWTYEDSKDEVCATSPAPGSPGSSVTAAASPEMDNIGMTLEDMDSVFLDQSAMEMHLTNDDDLPDSQLQELMYIAARVSGTQTDSGTESVPTPLEGSILSLKDSADSVELNELRRVGRPMNADHVYSSSTGIHGMSDNELVSYTVKQLNSVLKSYPVEQASDLKRRRRTLKNRGYAANSREKRTVVRSDLENANTLLATEVLTLREDATQVPALKAEVVRLLQEVTKVKEERDLYKNERDILLCQTQELL